MMKLGRSSRSTLISPMEQHGKQTPRVPTTTFLAAVGFLPVWAVTVVPLTVCYQIGKKIVSTLAPSSPPEPVPSLDSGYIVDEKSIIPRPDRKYDIVILGVTGFTGHLAALHLAKTYGVAAASGDPKKTVKWAVAGRNESKLRQVMKELAVECNNPAIGTDIDTIVVDTSVPSSMPKLVEQTRCVATTAGPYTLYGNAVVEFCAKYGTHYVDITGEIDWIRHMIVQWQSTAQHTGAILVPFCGHDSIPWDISVAKIQDILKKDCNNDELKSVSFWDEAIGGAPGGTIATLYANLEGKARKAPKENIDPFLKLSDGTKSVYNCISNNPYGMEKATSPWDVPDSKSSSNNEDRWCTPYVMAGVNYMVVRWQYALRHLQVDNKNISNTIMTYREVNAHSNFQTAMTTYLGLMYLGSMLFNPVTSYLLRHYVFPKPGEGPPMNDMENKHFLCVSGEGIGVNGNVVETIFYLPKDAGCLETSRMLVESGLSLALEEQKLPVKGGFYPPSIALGNDILLNRLVQTGTTFTSRVVPSKK